MSSTEVRFLQRIAGAKLEDDFSHVSEAGVFAAAYQEQDGMLPTTLRLVGEMSGGRAPTAVADYAPPPQGAVLGQETARLTREAPPAASQCVGETSGGQTPPAVASSAPPPQAALLAQVTALLAGFNSDSQPRVPHRRLWSGHRGH
jgi:hypothetical protein